MEKFVVAYLLIAFITVLAVWCLRGVLSSSCSQRISARRLRSYAVYLRSDDVNPVIHVKGYEIAFDRDAIWIAGDIEGNEVAWFPRKDVLYIVPLDCVPEAKAPVTA